MDEDRNIQLRLRWRKTWPDQPDDYVAMGPGYRGQIGRIYMMAGGPTGGRWFWAMHAHKPWIISRAGANSGYETSARRAARAVEDAWFEAIRGTSLEHAAPESAPANAYAAAKRGE